LGLGLALGIFLFSRRSWKALFSNWLAMTVGYAFPMACYMAFLGPLYVFRQWKLFLASHDKTLASGLTRVGHGQFSVSLIPRIIRAMVTDYARFYCFPGLAFFLLCLGLVSACVLLWRSFRKPEGEHSNALLSVCAGVLGACLILLCLASSSYPTSRVLFNVHPIIVTFLASAVPLAFRPLSKRAARVGCEAIFFVVPVLALAAIDASDLFRGQIDACFRPCDSEWVAQSLRGDVSASRRLLVLPFIFHQPGHALATSYYFSKNADYVSDDACQKYNGLDQLVVARKIKYIFWSTKGYAMVDVTRKLDPVNPAKDPILVYGPARRYKVDDERVVFARMLAQRHAQLVAASDYGFVYELDASRSRPNPLTGLNLSCWPPSKPTSWWSSPKNPAKVTARSQGKLKPFFLAHSIAGSMERIKLPAKGRVLKRDDVIALPGDVARVSIWLWAKESRRVNLRLSASVVQGTFHEQNHVDINELTPEPAYYEVTLGPMRQPYSLGVVIGLENLDSHACEVSVIGERIERVPGFTPGTPTPSAFAKKAAALPDPAHSLSSQSRARVKF
jgi:hypothetical protein